MRTEMYEEIQLPNGQKVTISKKGEMPFQLHLISKPKYFLTVEEAEDYAQKLKEQAMQAIKKTSKRDLL